MPRPVPVPPGRPTVPGAHSDEMVNRPRVVPTTRGEPGVPRQPDPMSPCAAAARRGPSQMSGCLIQSQMPPPTMATVTRVPASVSMRAVLPDRQNFSRWSTSALGHARRPSGYARAGPYGPTSADGRRAPFPRSTPGRPATFTRLLGYVAGHEAGRTPGAPRPACCSPRAGAGARDRGGIRTPRRGARRARRPSPAWRSCWVRRLRASPR